MENSRYKLDNTFPKKNELKLKGPDVQKSLGNFYQEVKDLFYYNIQFKVEAFPLFCFINSFLNILSKS